MCSNDDSSGYATIGRYLRWVGTERKGDSERVESEKMDVIKIL